MVYWPNKSSKLKFGMAQLCDGNILKTRKTSFSTISGDLSLSRAPGMFLIFSIQYSHLNCVSMDTAHQPEQKFNFTSILLWLSAKANVVSLRIDMETNQASPLPKL